MEEWSIRACHRFTNRCHSTACAISPTLASAGGDAILRASVIAHEKAAATLRGVLALMRVLSRNGATLNMRRELAATSRPTCRPLVG